MKTSLSLALLALLLACGETRIESVDDEILEEANANKAAAHLKLEQTALLGTWRGCQDTAETTSTRYDYTFTSDGQVKLLQVNYATLKCEGDGENAGFLNAGWQVVPVKDSEDFTLQLKWGEGQKIESQYRLAEGKAQLPRLLELQGRSDLKLIELKNKDQLLELEKAPTDEIEKVRKKSEALVIDFATSLLSRKGTWASACQDSQKTVLAFNVAKPMKVTVTTEVYQNKECKDLTEEQPKSETLPLALIAVPDLDKKNIVVESEKKKGNLKVSYQDMNKLELSDLVGDKKTMKAYEFVAAGVDP